MRIATHVPPRRTLATGLKYPEGQIAMPDGSVILVEIAGGTLKRVRPDGSVETVANVGGGPNGAAIGPDGRIYVTNNGGVMWKPRGEQLRPAGNLPNPGSIQVVDPDSGRFETLYARCGEREFRHCNDLVFDAHGGFWFTDTGKVSGRTQDRGSVFWAKADGSEVREVMQGLMSPNGIGLSPDGKHVYVAETTTARLWGWEISAPGEVVKTRGPMPHGGTFLFGSSVWQRFDSLAVSASGKILVATLDNGGITEIWPDGSDSCHYPFGTPYVNNVCFGGADLRTLFVTQSGDGTLTALPWHEPGLRLNHQQLPK
jgi:gluconolactonase